MNLLIAFFHITLMIVMGYKWIRKIQGANAYSSYVNLPKFWILQNELEGPGKTVQIETMPDGSLKVTPGGALK